jgi:hypothetical protein
MTYLERDPELGATPENPKRFSRAWYRQELNFLYTLATRGLIRRGVDWDDGDGQHTHVCGYDPIRTHRKGCGHIWRHAAPSTNGGLYDTKEELDKAHKCPQCGREHWTAKRLPGDPRLMEKK